MGRPKGSKNQTKSTASQGAKRKGQSRTGNQGGNRKTLMGDEVGIIITFAVSVFLFLSNLGLCGPAGTAIRSVQLGLFGTLGYVFPVLLLCVVIFVYTHRQNPYAVLKMTAALFALIFLSSVLQLTAGSGMEGMQLGDFYQLGAEEGRGGGVIGGALAMVLYAIVGQIGAMLILLVAILICLVYVTEKPLMRMLANSSIHAAGVTRDRVKEDLDHFRESARIRSEERRRYREERDAELARGVDFGAISLSGTEAPDRESLRPAQADNVVSIVRKTGGKRGEAPKVISEGRGAGPNGEIELPLNVRHRPGTIRHSTLTGAGPTGEPGAFPKDMPAETDGAPAAEQANAGISGGMASAGTAAFSPEGPRPQPEGQQLYPEGQRCLPSLSQVCLRIPERT